LGVLGIAGRTLHACRRLAGRRSADAVQMTTEIEIVVFYPHRVIEVQLLSASFARSSGMALIRKANSSWRRSKV
jgi:hypothetical protein